VVYVFLSVETDKEKNYSLMVFIFSCRFATVKKYKNNFLDSEPSGKIELPCRASPDGYSLTVHRQGNSFFISMAVF
jgi:hypothetical protein